MLGGRPPDGIGCARLVVRKQRPARGTVPMKAITLGLDIAKDVFQVHGEDASGKAVLQKRLRRSQVLKFFAKLEPALIGIEACGSAHYWGRELRSLGHEVRLIPPAYVKPFVRRNKNDARDAAAICTACAVRTCALLRSRASKAKPRAGLSGRATCWSNSTPS